MAAPLSIAHPTASGQVVLGAAGLAGGCFPVVVCQLWISSFRAAKAASTADSPPSSRHDIEPPVFAMDAVFPPDVSRNIEARSGNFSDSPKVESDALTFIDSQAG
jgi:hypothetical protein